MTYTRIHSPVIEEKPEPTESKPTHRFESEPPSKLGSKNKKRACQSEPDTQFRGVRKRSWGRYVSEIRLPGTKTRVWLGSFGSAEMAARAHDSAALFLKGNSACLNFPDLAESLPRPESSSRRDIQSAAAKAALLELADNRSELGAAGQCVEPDFWCVFDDDFGIDLGSITSFEEVKEAPLLSPLSFEDSSTVELGDQLLEDDELFLESGFHM